MNTTLVINPKGGARKTTIRINLPSPFAADNTATPLLAYARQGSGLHWLRSRAPEAAKIHGANAAPPKPDRLRSFEMYVPPETRQLVIDTPAGASGLLLQEMLGRAHCVIVPVVPSSLDIHATANFIKDLLLKGRIRERNIRLAVVANRVRRSMPVYPPLERFLNALNMKLLARLIDSDVYVHAAETGVGIFEMDFPASVSERKQFTPIIDWVDSEQAPRDDRTAGTLYELGRTRTA